MHLPKRTLLLLFLILSHTLLFAQDARLVQIRSAKDDTTKIQQLDAYAKDIMRSDPGTAHRVFEEVIRLGEKLHTPFWIGMAWTDKGNIHAARGEEDRAIACYKTAIAYFKKSNSTEKIAKCLLNWGNCEEALGNVETGVQIGLDAVRLLERADPNDKVLQSLLGRAYSSVGITLYNLDDFSKAQVYLEKALPINRALNDTSRLIMNLYGLSACLSSETKYEAALALAQEAVQLARSSNTDDYLHLANQSAAEIYVKMKNAPKAIAYANQSLHYAVAAGQMHFQLPALMTLADAYGISDNQAMRLSYLNEAKRLSETNNIVLQFDEIYKGLSEAYEKTGHPAEALDYYKKYDLFRDSVEGEKVKKHVSELELKYQTAQKEKALSQQRLQVVQQEAQLQKSRHYILYSIGATLIALLLAVLVYVYYRNKKKAHDRAIQSLQKDREIQVLQAVMQGEERERSRIAKDLHDGVAGMLAAVKMHFSSITTGDAPTQNKAYQQGMHLLNEAASELRKTSHNLMPEVLFQHGLDEALRRYCGSLNNSHTLEVQYDSWGAISRFNDSFELSVYRIVQELVNNIIKHSKASLATVQLSQRASLLCISIEDNGVGFTKPEAASDGMGLRSLRSRIKAMNGRMELDTAPQSGVTAYLEFETAGLQKNTHA